MGQSVNICTQDISAIRSETYHSDGGGRSHLSTLALFAKPPCAHPILCENPLAPSTPPHSQIGGLRQHLPTPPGFRVASCASAPAPPHLRRQGSSNLFPRRGEMEVEHGEEEVMMVVVEEQGWETPRREECRIPVVPPRKKAVALPELGKERREPPKGGYFQPPDLESLFAPPPPRRQASSCA